MLADVSPHARAGAGFDANEFTVDFDTQQVTCPQGKTSTSWSPARQRGTDTIVVKFDADTCRPCPVRDQCTLHLSDPGQPSDPGTSLRGARDLIHEYHRAA